MARPKTHYVCTACGGIAPRWAGRCDACGAWNTLEPEAVTESAPVNSSGTPALTLSRQAVAKAGELAKPLSHLSHAAHAQEQRFGSGLVELDRVAGGGLVQGGTVLLGGDPGIGKSTLMLQVAMQAAAQGAQTLYVTGEESAAQIGLRAARLGFSEAEPLAAAETRLDTIAALLEAVRPHIAVIDSAQTLWSDSLPAAPGSVAQVRACTLELSKLARRRGIALLLVSHMTKDGQLAGPKVVEHMVDAVFQLEGDRTQRFRILRGLKNRFGPTDEIGVFEMAGAGLIEVHNPSALFLGEGGDGASGTAVFAGLEGSRPLLTEIQALVAPPGAAGSPRRTVSGWDSARLAMTLAVLQARCGLNFADRDVYLNVAGGLRIQEPAVDLAVAAALISSLLDTPLPPRSVVFGETALSGAVRPVARPDLRLKEAEKLGFEHAFVPADETGAQPVLQSRPIARLEALVNVIGDGSPS